MQKTVQVEISKAIQRELEKIPVWRIMLLLQERGEMSAYQIAKELGWTTGKVHSLIKKLEKSRAIKTKTKIISGRAVKLVKLGDQ